MSIQSIQYIHHTRSHISLCSLWRFCGTDSSIHLEDATSLQVVSLHWSWNVDGLGHRLNYPKNVSTTQRCKDWDEAKMFVMFLHMSNLVSLGCQVSFFLSVLGSHEILQLTEALLLWACAIMVCNLPWLGTCLCHYCHGTQAQWSKGAQGFQACLDLALRIWFLNHPVKSDWVLFHPMVCDPSLHLWLTDSSLDWTIETMETPWSEPKALGALHSRAGIPGHHQKHAILSSPHVL